MQEGYDSPRAIAGAALSDLERKRVRPGHAVALREKAADLGPDDVAEDGAPRIPPPKLFDYDTIVSSLTVADATETVEDAFYFFSPRGAIPRRRVAAAPRPRRG